LSDVKVAHDAALQQWKNLTFQHILRDQELETKALTFKNKTICFIERPSLYGTVNTPSQLQIQ
jgi:hypothetical protein